ncbi:uroporphyrinogen-III C-methyltransferase [Paludibacterium purpuratum]|uniref:Uroporphyrin-3 C-methyltransferase n=1 Tax=Paludibacterium purpuratum TaxID=1144873 RepID=A0A4R7B3F0_9NEIS|nr:uroporphyrinogen-III C-methyltransferase [Paludibacterium purpuratum]TDR76505.1 uroporphyrin-3 C-methyltransferase [Paludibacterium purpuratum]
MSETQHPDAEKSEQQILPPQEKKPFNWALWLALGALALSGWQLYNTELELSSIRRALPSHTADPAIKAQGEQLRATDGKLALLEAKFNQSTSQFATLSSMYQDLSKVRTDWLLSEVGHALALASQELQLAGNVPAAISALQAVDARLATFDRPELIGVKKSVAHDLEALKALPFLDIIGLSARIDSLSQGVDTLPLSVDIQRQPQTPAAIDRNAPFWSRLIRDISQSFGELVRIRRIDKPEAVLLTPEQSFQLRENLKLHLLDARIALLQRNAAPFKADMVELQSYVDRYFDHSAPTTKQWLAVLDELKAAPINNALPDLSDSLKAVNSAQAAPEVKP